MSKEPELESTYDGMYAAYKAAEQVMRRIGIQTNVYEEKGRWIVESAFDQTGDNGKFYEKNERIFYQPNYPHEEITP